MEYVLRGIPLELVSQLPTGYEREAYEFEKTYVSFCVPVYHPAVSIALERCF